MNKLHKIIAIAKMGNWVQKFVRNKKANAP
jgi:hypothetical protein